MCGDLVSNHGTTGRASIERAEARPFPPSPLIPLLLGAMSVVLVQTNPTQCFPLTSHPLSQAHSLSLSLTLELYLPPFPSLLYPSSEPSTSQPTVSATHSERPHPLRTTPNRPVATSSTRSTHTTASSMSSTLSAAVSNLGQSRGPASLSPCPLSSSSLSSFGEISQITRY